MKLVILIISAYLFGSINFSIMLFRFFGKDDPRKKFSGNAGTTNVYRQAGPVWASVIFALDIGRAVLVGLIAWKVLSPGEIPWPGLALVIGNHFPCFHGFKGGKGVANYLGFSAVISPLSAIIASLVWVGIYLLKRVPFLASLAMVIVLSFGTMIVCHFKAGAIIGTALTSLFIIYNHKTNISDYMKKETLSGERSDSATSEETRDED